MLPCFRQLARASADNYFSAPVSPGFSVDDTPASSAQLSPTVNLAREYTLAVQTNSYGEIRTIFHRESSFDQNVRAEQVEFIGAHQFLEQVLQPSRDCVQEALLLIESNSHTHLVASYFEYSENTARLCLLLYQSVLRARQYYNPVHNLLDDLPLEFESSALSHSECTRAFNVFLQFHSFENPFISNESPDFDDVRQCFSQFREQLDHRLGESKSRVHRHCSTGSALCLIAAGVGVAISAVAIASHALIALIASPICPVILTSYVTMKEPSCLTQLDAAAKGAYLLHRDLDTNDRLVAQLHSDVDNDKRLIHLGVDRGMDWYFIQEVLKQLQRNRTRFIQQLVTLEDHLFICFAAVNRARKHLLQEIHTHQIHTSD